MSKSNQKQPQSQHSLQVPILSPQQIDKLNLFQIKSSNHTSQTSVRSLRTKQDERLQRKSKTLIMSKQQLKAIMEQPTPTDRLNRTTKFSASGMKMKAEKSVRDSRKRMNSTITNSNVLKNSNVHVQKQQVTCQGCCLFSSKPKETQNPFMLARMQKNSQ